MLQAIFYTRFHPERGRSVIHQYPNGSIVPSPDHETASLVSFGDISAYIIPPYELCNRPLSIAAKGHKVLGYPVSLEDEKYERNRFTFNICFVLSEDEDARPWQQVVKKTAAFFTALEVEDGILQAEERLPGLKWAGEQDYPASDVGVVYTLLEAISEDLDTYSETCIRIDDLHVLNLRLTVPRPTPPKVQAWDVPILVRALSSPDQWTWDLTLQRIRPFIDGIKHVQRIAELADVELKLVKRAVRELIYHDRVKLFDIFHFQAIYTPTTDLAWFLRDEQMLEECRRYISIPSENHDSHTGKHTDGESVATLDNTSVINLCTSLSLGVSIHDFVLAHEAKFTGIDIRRFITFGVIKGFLRRVHKYALADHTPASTTLRTSGSSPSKSKPKSNEDALRDFDRAWKKAALTSGWATPPTELPAAMQLSKSNRSDDQLRTEDDEKMRAFLDGKHCMDEICVAMKMSERKIVERLKSGRFGEVVLFNK